MNTNKNYPYASISKNIYHALRVTVWLTILFSLFAIILSLLSKFVVKVAHFIFDANWGYEWYQKTNAKNDGAMDNVPLLKHVFPDTSQWANKISNYLILDGSSPIMSVLSIGLMILGVFLVLYLFTIVMRHHNGEMAPFFNDMESVRLKRKIIRSIGAGIRDIYDESNRKIRRVEHGARFSLRRMDVSIHTTLDKGQPKPTKKYSIVIKKPRKSAVDKVVLNKIKDLQDILTGLTDGVSFDQMKTTANRRYYTFDGAVERQLKEARSVVKRRQKKEQSIGLGEGTAEGDTTLTFPLELLNDVGEKVVTETRKAEEFTESIKDKVSDQLSTLKIQAELVDTFTSSKTTVLTYAYSYSKNQLSDSRIGMDISNKIRIPGVLTSSNAGRMEVSVPFPEDIQIPIDYKGLIDREIANKRNLKPTDSIYGVLPDGSPVIKEISKAPHLLVVGTTGSGKSVGLNTLIIGMLAHNTPEDVKLMIIDPKKVEFKLYVDSPYLLTNPITEVEDGAIALKYAVLEMEKRYKLFEDNNVKKIEDYNKLANNNDKLKKMPFLVLVIDEFSDFKDSLDDFKEVEKSIRRLGQKARACGIHLILATQSPRSEVITGIIKANLPLKIAFQTASSLESRIALDDTGDNITADKLLGKGDMLIKEGSKITRAQGAYLSDEEIKAINDHWRNTFEKPIFVDYKSVVAREDGEEMSSEKEAQFGAISNLQQTRLDNHEQTPLAPKKTALEKAKERKEKKKERTYQIDMSKYFKDAKPKQEVTEKQEQPSETMKEEQQSASDILGI